MSNQYVMALVGCIILQLGSITASAKDTGTVTGRILDEHQAPFDAVAVTIEGFTIGAYTDERGEFNLSDIPAGSQHVVVSRMDIKSIKIPIQVRPDGIINLGDIQVEEIEVLLDEVQVVGKSEARRMQEQAYALSVLDVKKSYTAATPLSKLLGQVSSVRIREEGGVGSNHQFSLNGFSGNQVKFFLDGVPMDNFGSSFSITDISANMAERIEVYKGVLPVSLGGDALGGAINIVSRKSTNYVDASYSFGSFNTHKAALNAAYTDAKSGLTWRLNGFYNYSDNDYRVYAPILDLATNKVTDQRWVKRFNDNYRSAGARLETGVTNKPYADYLLAGLILSQNSNQVQTGATMDAVYGGVRSRSQSVIASLRYKKEDLLLDGLSVSLYGTYGHVNSYHVDTLARRYNWLGEWVASSTAGERYLTDAQIANREWMGSLNLNYVVNEHHSITVNHLLSSIGRTAHDAAHPTDPMNDIPQRLTKNITGLDWQVRYDRWNANLFGKLYNLYSSTYKRLDEYTETARWEQVADTKLHLGYGAAATLHLLPTLQTKLSYELAYRMPEGIELFGDGLIQQRNPNLKPESSHNLNLGLNYTNRFGRHQLAAEGNLIYRNTHDFIHKGVSLTGNPTTGYENLGKVLTRGVEASLRYGYGEWLSVGGNITYQDIEDKQKVETNAGSFTGEGITENITYGQRLPNIPYLFANADLGLTFRNVGGKQTALTLNYHLNYVHAYYLSFPGLGNKASKKVIPEQLSHDLSVGYSLRNGTYGLVAECTNLTDQKLYDNYRLQKPGRAFQLKFRYYFAR